ncbi:hypothetical protein Q3O98_17285, partial [Ralstonia pseudosolanacearum]|uniref:hypothetical protein n=1 Tax=Ralstonia pseudosolanacearum TaxID=1310165 RepID=UPI0026751FBA
RVLDVLFSTSRIYITTAGNFQTGSKNSEVEFHYPFEGRPRPLARAGLFVFAPDVYMKLSGFSARAEFEKRELGALHKRMTRYLERPGEPEQGAKLLAEVIEHLPNHRMTDYMLALAGGAEAKAKVERQTTFEALFHGMDTDPVDWQRHHFHLIAMERVGVVAYRKVKAGDIAGAADYAAEHPLAGRLVWPEAYEVFRKALSLQELQPLLFAMALESHLGCIAAWDVDLASRAGTQKSVLGCLLPSQTRLGRNPTSLFYDELQRRLGKRSIKQVLDEQPRISGVDMWTLNRWSAGTHSPDFESLKALLGAYGLDQPSEVLYSQYWCTKHVHLLGYYANRFVNAAHKLAGTADATRIWPWPAYPFEQPTFETWVAKRYPDWLAFHRENGASLPDWAAPAPEDKAH